MAKDETIIQTLSDTPKFSSFVRLLRQSGLDKLLGEGDKHITVFAPNNEAFAVVSDRELAKIVDDPMELSETVRYHLVNGTIPADELKTYTEIESMNGEDITIEKVDGDILMANDAEVLESNIEASNGMIHEIDRVLSF